MNKALRESVTHQERRTQLRVDAAYNAIVQTVTDLKLNKQELAQLKTLLGSLS